MANNVTLPATGTGDATPKVASEDDGTAQHQLVLVEWGPAATRNRTDVAAGKSLPVQLRDSANGTDVTVGAATTIKASVTRPADTTAYAANDAWADSTTVPTAGGFTLTGAGRVSGGSGIITDVLVSSSNDPATLLQGEFWLLDQAGTAVNDNAAFSMADADVLNVIAVIPFTMLSTQAGSGANSYCHQQNLSIGFTCVGTANLRFLVKVKNAYTPASAEKLQFALKFIQDN